MLTILAEPLRSHESEQRYGHDSLPACRAADLNRERQQFRIEQAGTGVCSRDPLKDGAFPRPPPRHRADDGCDDGDDHKERGHEQGREHAAELDRKPVVTGDAEKRKRRRPSGCDGGNADK
jgi:hypothetical protein